MEEATNQSAGNDHITIRKPHAKNLMSPVGRLINRASYLKLGIVTLAVIGSSTAYFYYAPSNEGINKSSDSAFFDSLYFTLVTFTSLGYGDFLPVGFGRAVAAAVVLAGLGLVALLVGKVASERQYSMLLLVHTSDCQRRISGFANEFLVASQMVESDCRDAPQQLRASTRNMMELLEAARNYIVFHLYQSELTAFGNETALSILIRNMSVAQVSCTRAFQKATEPLVAKRCISVSKKMHELAALILTFEEQARRDTRWWAGLGKWLSKISQKREAAEADVSDRDRSLGKARTLSRMRLELEELENLQRTSFNIIVVDRVRAAAPVGPVVGWPKDTHKTIATSLGISRNVAARSLKYLIDTKQLPKKPLPVIYEHALHGHLVRKCLSFKEILNRVLSALQVGDEQAAMLSLRELGGRLDSLPKGIKESKNFPNIRTGKTGMALRDLESSIAQLGTIMPPSASSVFSAQLGVLLAELQTNARQISSEISTWK